MARALKVVFLAAEADPFIKVGGLGDVAGSLPPALRRLSADIRLILPLHGAIRQQGFSLAHVCQFSLPYAGTSVPVDVYETNLMEVPVYFIDGPLIPSEAPIYSGDHRQDTLKYAFFSLASLQLMRELNWQVDILHANDWHTALAVYGLDIRKRTDRFFTATASILGIHNLPYMGSRLSEVLRAFDLPQAADPILPVWADDLPLALGILKANHIVPVSPTYAREILTPEFGSGLEKLLTARADSITGILNGLDTANWDPASDPSLVSNYDVSSIERRKENRISLLRTLGLPSHPDAILIGMISRLEYQKGVDLVPEALYQLPTLLDEPSPRWQLIILGMGDPKIEKEIYRLEKKFPGRVRAAIGFNQILSRQIYSAADLMLIPSRYEPCGLTQMIAMRYGCIPLGRATGGLLDTIRDFDQTEESTGFLFTEATSDALLKTLVRALQVFKDEETWKALQQRGMRQDLSWEISAGKYLKLYHDIHNKILQPSAIL